MHLIFAPELGEAVVGSERVPIVPVESDGSVRICDPSELVVRPLRFAERTRILVDSLQSDEPVPFCSDLIAHAATNRAPHTVSMVGKALALVLAGGGLDAPSLSRTVELVSAHTGWSRDRIDATPAVTIDRIACDMAPRDESWTKVVFPEKGDDDIDAIITELAVSLLKRTDVAMARWTETQVSPAAMQARSASMSPRHEDPTRDASIPGPGEVNWESYEEQAREGRVKSPWLKGEPARPSLSHEEYIAPGLSAVAENLSPANTGDAFATAPDAINPSHVAQWDDSRRKKPGVKDTSDQSVPEKGLEAGGEVGRTGARQFKRAWAKETTQDSRFSEWQEPMQTGFDVVRFPADTKTPELNASMLPEQSELKPLQGVPPDKEIMVPDTLDLSRSAQASTAAPVPSEAFTGRGWSGNRDRIRQRPPSRQARTEDSEAVLHSTRTRSQEAEDQESPAFAPANVSGKNVIRGPATNQNAAPGFSQRRPAAPAKISLVQDTPGSFAESGKRSGRLESPLLDELDLAETLADRIGRMLHDEADLRGID